MAKTGKRQREGAGGGEGGSGKRGSAAQQQQPQAPAGSDGRGQELPGESGFREAERVMLMRESCALLHGIPDRHGMRPVVNDHCDDGLTR
jgi:hypothetical protein